MKNYIKLIVIFSLRVILRVFYIFPIKQKRILFSASEGEAYSCSPKYVYKSLRQRYGDKFEYIWCLNNKNLIPQAERVKTVKFLSFAHIFYLMTSKVIVSNLGIEPFIPKRKNQLFINTWHGGGCYKDSGIDSAFITKSQVRVMAYMRDVRAKMTNYLVSSCSVFTTVYSEKFNIPKECVLNIGLPRNDLFFNNVKSDIRSTICEAFHIPPQSIIVLYAPTFRGLWRKSTHTVIDLDVAMLCEVVKKRFGKNCTILFRQHRFLGVEMIPDTIDVSSYQDMQELLCAADILITDYSSSIWDFSLMHKPGFLFTPDLEEYEKVTKFHTPIKDWQYPTAKNMNELCDNILSYDEEKAVERIDKHLKMMGSFENGSSTNRVCDIIAEWCMLK